jgi:hypothetical protein
MRRMLTLALLTCVAALATATGASAQTEQNGLVNINVEDNVVQVPIAIAANICDVTVAVLVSDLADDSTATCDALAESDATVTPRPSGGPTRQDGLINVNLENNTVQIPIAAAANVCDVDVFVLASAILLDDATSCDAGAGAGGIA